MVLLDGLNSKLSYFVIDIGIRVIEAIRSASAPLELSFQRVTGSTKGPLVFSFLAHVPWMMTLTFSGKFTTSLSSVFLFPKRVYKYLAS